MVCRLLMKPEQNKSKGKYVACMVTVYLLLKFFENKHLLHLEEKWSLIWGKGVYKAV